MSYVFFLAFIGLGLLLLSFGITHWLGYHGGSTIRRLINAILAFIGSAGSFLYTWWYVWPAFKSGSPLIRTGLSSFADWLPVWALMVLFVGLGLLLFGIGFELLKHNDRIGGIFSRIFQSAMSLVGAVATFAFIWFFAWPSIDGSHSFASTASNGKIVTTSTTTPVVTYNQATDNSHFQRRIDNLQVKTEQLRSENIKLADELKASELSTSELKNEAKTRQDRLKQLVLSVDQKDNELTDLKALLTNAKTEVEKTQAEADQLRTKIKSLNSEIAKHDSEISALRHQIADLGTKAADQDREIANVRDRLSKNRFTSAELEEEVSSLRIAQRNFGADRDRLESSLARQKVKTIELEDDNASLRTRLHTAQTKGGTHSSDEVAELKDQLFTSRKRQDSLKISNADLLRETDQLRSEIAREKKLIKSSNVNELTTSSLRRKLSMSNEEVSRLHSKLAALQNVPDVRTDDDMGRMQRTLDLLREEKLNLGHDKANLSRQMRNIHVLLREVDGGRVRSSLRVVNEFGTAKPTTNEEYYQQIRENIAVLRSHYDSVGKTDCPDTGSIDRRASLPAPMGRLQTQMDGTLSTDSYDVDVLPERELISGRSGKYYVVSLKNADNAVKFTFPNGQYTLPKSNRALSKTLRSFSRDILNRLHGQVDYQLFVRGSATRSNFTGKQANDHRYSQISYLPSLSDNRYESSPNTQFFTQEINNNDLPNLRAAFLQELVAQSYPVKKPIILEGEVTDKLNPSDRSVSLILYVGW